MLPFDSYLYKFMAVTKTGEQPKCPWTDEWVNIAERMINWKYKRFISCSGMKKNVLMEGGEVRKLQDIKTMLRHLALC